MVVHHHFSAAVCKLRQFGCLLTESASTLTTDRAVIITTVLCSSSHFPFMTDNQPLEWSFLRYRAVDLCSTLKTIKYN